MEYEIEEERELLDESNNPSLDRSPNPAAKAPAPSTLQKAEPIPEESVPA